MRDRTDRQPSVLNKTHNSGKMLHATFSDHLITCYARPKALSSYILPIENSSPHIIFEPIAANGLTEQIHSSDERFAELKEYYNDTKFNDTLYSAINYFFPYGAPLADPKHWYHIHGSPYKCRLHNSEHLHPVDKPLVQTTQEDMTLLVGSFDFASGRSVFLLRFETVPAEKGEYTFTTVVRFADDHKLTTTAKYTF